MEKAGEIINLLISKDVDYEDILVTTHLNKLCDDPNNTLILNELCDLYEAKKLYQKALLCSKLVSQLEPMNAFAKIKIARIFTKLNNFESAINEYNSAIDIMQNPPRYVYVELGDVLDKCDRIIDAASAYNLALNIAEDNITILGRVAKIKAKQGMFQESITIYQKIVTSQTDTPIWVYREMGNIYDKLGNCGKAINAYQRVVDLKPESVSDLEKLAEAYEKNNNFNQAEDCYQKILDLQPASGKIKVKLTRLKIKKDRGNEFDLIPKINLVKGIGDHADSFFIRGFSPLHQNHVTIQTVKEINVNNNIFFYIVNAALIYSIQKNYCQTKGIKHFSQEISDNIINNVRQNKGYLILDTSNEGPQFNGKLLQAIHDTALELKISPSRIIWMHQNLSWSFYTDWANTQNISQEHRIKILYWHAFLVDLSNKLSILYPTSNEKQNHISYFLSLKKTRQKHFLCFNNAGRPSRVFIFLNLVQNKIIQKGLVSFRSMKKNRKLNFNTVQPLYEKLFPNYIYLLDNLDKVEAMLPLTVDSSGDSHQNELVSNFDPEPYTRTYFSVVTESEMTWGETKRFTEKVFKPILNFHPFIVAGNPGTLSLLREMGFKTFDCFFDESYDEIKNPEERALHVIREVDRLCSMPIEEIHEMYQKILPILTYNSEHLLNYIPVWIRDIMGGEIMYQLRNYAQII